jgi:hypothetical protein
LRRFRLHGFRRREDRVELFVFDFDQLDRLGGDLSGLSGHGRDFIADEAGNAVENPATVVEPAAIPDRARRVFRRQHAQHAGQRESLGRIDFLDARMGMPAAQDLSVQHSLHFEIDGVFERAGDLFGGILYRQTFPDVSESASLHLAHQTRASFLPPRLRRLMRCAAVMTALTM